MDQTFSKEEIAVLLAGAAKNMERDGHLMPVFFIRSPDGIQILAAPADLSDARVKEALAAEIRRRCAESKATGLIFVSEAWIRTQSIDDPILKPSECADRREVITAIVENAVGPGSSHMANVTRDADGSATVGPWKHLGPATGGMFTGLLPSSTVLH